MGVSADAPSLDIAYKLCGYAGEGRLKLSTGKPVLPGRKQVFRVSEGERDVRDVIARGGESLPGRPLLEPVMRGGKRLPESVVTLDAARGHAREQIARLPCAVRGLAPGEPPYPIEISPALSRLQEEVRAQYE